MSQAHYGLILEGDRLVVTRTPRTAFFDPRFLVAALLEHVARSDGRVCELESAAMVALVARHFEMDESQAELKLAQALSLYARTLDLAETGRLLQEILDPLERQRVLLMLLEVIAADGRQQAEELSALDEIATVLRLTGEERHAAFERYFRQRERVARADTRRIHLK